ncbi:hypothetical protein GCM10017562_29220 [Streptomyces roseofulvus]
MIFATSATPPRTDSTRHGRSFARPSPTTALPDALRAAPFDGGPSSKGTSAHQISRARGSRAPGLRTGGRAGGRVRPDGRVRAGGRVRLPATATTSAITTTATSAGHHDVSIPHDVTGARLTAPPRPAVHPNR